MKCPLLHHKEHNPDVFPGETFEDCLKEECAWWYARNQSCVALSIADRLLDLALALEAIKERKSINVQLAK